MSAVLVTLLPAKDHETTGFSGNRWSETRPYATLTCCRGQALVVVGGEHIARSWHDMLTRYKCANTASAATRPLTSAPSIDAFVR